MNKIKWIYILFGLSLSLSQYACSNDADSKSEEDSGKPVTVYTVEEEMITDRQQYPAYVVPLEETELYAEVSGFVRKIFVADGDYVRKGQKLYEIDDIRYSAAVEQAEANLQNAEAEYARTRKDLDRYEELAKDNAIALQTLDYTRTDLENRSAAIKNSRASLKTAKTDFNRSIIYAPYSGIVGVSRVRQGSHVTAGTTTLNILSTVDPITVEFQANERYIDLLLDLKKKESSDNIQIELPKSGTYEHGGKIYLIDREVDRSTGTIRVRALFKNPEHRLRAGMNLKLTLVESEEKKLVIPQKALVSELGKYHVFVATDSDTAAFKEVEAGTRFDGKVVIKSGLERDQKVVTEGVRNLSDGAKLRVEEK
ncbi:efflux RND transporter periplasmic adaptor subunit [Sphingobacterium sp. lm-10]|uniref:efflux RND transporter periplasmic adaptor subunit n=1 Tax=Sphingobacterium sp. lm-10 TaxID=2944904 RepID=UPI002021BECE|nr:efflux RND transporter periplasmic adaptor subunit [Sphingobacterium sp. lm-10]MCL7989096.1 efflux RND transporter periplasmic adaptor subunit [Sphingobacterium sp. lm-10]